MPTMPTSPTPRWVLRVTIGGVSIVAAVAAVASYVHMYELAEHAGEDVRAFLFPLSVDGLLVAASMVMLVRRRAGEPAGTLPWIGLVLGLAASLGANVAAGIPPVLEWVKANPWAVTGWPPLALAVAFELLIMVTRDREPVPETVPDRVPDERVPDRVPDERVPDRVPDERVPDRVPDRRRTGSGRVPATDEQVLGWMRDERARTGTVPGRRAAGDEWSIGATRYERLAAIVADEPGLRVAR